jgi:hypothetical protein
MINPRETPPDSYQAYLLRIWQESQSGADGLPPCWRFSLEDARSGTRRGFANLDSLADYLRDLLSGSSPNG